MKKKVERIKKPLLIPLAIVLLFLLGVAIIGTYNDQQQNIANDMADMQKGVDKLFSSMLAEEAILIGSLLDFYENDTLLQNAFLAQDREKLLQEATPIFQTLHSKYNITHFYFHKPDRINFLRVHKPQRYGDYIDRITLDEAVREGKNAEGIELGPLGTFTLRIVRPWLVGGELVGYLELGKEIEHLTPQLKNILGLEFIFTVNKSFLQRDKWEEGMKMMNRVGNWDELKESVVIDKTLETFPTQLVDVVNLSLAPHKMQVVDLGEKNKIYSCGFISLKDAAGKTVGEITILKNIAQKIHASQLFLLFLTLLGIFLGTLLLVFFYKLIGRLEGKLIRARETTEAQYDELEKLTAVLRESNRITEEKNQALELAYNEVTFLIGLVVSEENFHIRYQNQNLVPCYEVKACQRTDCPCHGGPPQRCWQVAGTFCGGKVQGEFAQKYKNCTACEIFKKASFDPVLMIGEEFNNMMHLLETKHVELQQANNEIKNTQAQMLQREKMASVGQLAAGVAHEINNPMGFITSNLGTLQKYVNKFIEFVAAQAAVLASLSAEDQVKEMRKKMKLDFIIEDIRNLLEESLDGAKRVSEIVQNLKSFSHLDEAKILQADINLCIENTLKIIWNELKYKTTIHKDYGELPLTFCNAQELNQVFMNILINAAHAIENQGDITIQTSAENGMITVHITDTGSGIAAENLEHVFEPFFTTKEVGKGTGLGLSICYDIVKKHEGTITVQSEIGKGTTFTISLPVKENA